MAAETSHGLETFFPKREKNIPSRNIHPKRQPFLVTSLLEVNRLKVAHGLTKRLVLTRAMGIALGCREWVHGRRAGPNDQPKTNSGVDGATAIDSFNSFSGREPGRSRWTRGGSLAGRAFPGGAWERVECRAGIAFLGYAVAVVGTAAMNAPKIDSAAMRSGNPGRYRSRSNTFSGRTGSPEDALLRT